MSIPAINLALSLAHLRLPAGSRLVLVRLADRANHAGLAWPTVSSIARDVGLSERQVQRHLRRLAQLNLIRVHSPSTRTTSTTYRIFPGVTLVSPKDCPRGDIRDAEGVTHVAPEPPSESPMTGRTGCVAPNSELLKPVAPMRVLTKLAHRAIDTLGPDALIADLAADLKCLCAKHHLTATPHAMTGALESALHQRRRTA